MLVDPTLEKSTISCRPYNPFFFKKHHSLIMSRIELSPREHDLLSLLFTHLHRDHYKKIEDGLEIKTLVSYEFSSTILSEWFNLEYKHLSTKLKPPCDRLSSKKIGIEHENGNFRYIPLFSEIKYENSILTVTPNPILIYDFVLASSGHAKIPINSFKSLKSEYAKRLFSLFCRFRDKGTVLHKKDLKWLYGFLGLLDDKGELTKKTYQKPSVFIKTIIKPAIIAIAKTEHDIQFLIDPDSGELGFKIITAHKTISIEFLFKWKTQRDQEKEVNQPPHDIQTRSIEPIRKDYSDYTPPPPQQRQQRQKQQVHVSDLPIHAAQKTIERNKQQAKAEGKYAWERINEQLKIRNQSQCVTQPEQQQPEQEKEKIQTELELTLINFKESLKQHSLSLKSNVLKNFENSENVKSLSVKIDEVSGYIKLIDKDDQSVEHLSKLADIALKLFLYDIFSSLRKEIDARTQSPPNKKILTFDNIEEHKDTIINIAITAILSLYSENGDSRQEMTEGEKAAFDLMSVDYMKEFIKQTIDNVVNEELKKRSDKE